MRIGSLAGGFTGTTSGCAGGSLIGGGFGSGGCGGSPGRSGAGCFGIGLSYCGDVALHSRAHHQFAHNNADHIENALREIERHG
jgi:hypothetical protein